MHIDVAVAGPNPACPRYFGRDGQRGKDALRELQAGLRKFALLTCTGPPPSASASTPTTPTTPSPMTLNSPTSSSSSSATMLPGLSLSLLQEVTRYIPHGFSTRAVAKHLVLPLALSHRTALCDVPGLLYRKQVTPAVVQVVHAWDAPFHDLSTLIQEYAAHQANPAQDSLYIDVLCANLYSSVTGSQRIKDVKAQLKAAPAILIVLSSTGALNRTWVLYQIWLVAREHRMADTTLLLRAPLSKEMVRSAAKNISLRHSMADQEDKDAVLADVLRSHTASAAFDTEVYQVLLRKLMAPAEAAAYELQLQQQELERQRQVEAHMEHLNLTNELREFQAEARPPRALALGSAATTPSPTPPAGFDAGAFMSGLAAEPEPEAPAPAPATASTPAGGFDPGAFMAGFLGIAKSASRMTDDGAPGAPAREDDEAMEPTPRAGAGDDPAAAFMAGTALGLPVLSEEPEHGSRMGTPAAAAPAAAPAPAPAAVAAAPLSASAVQLLSRLHKAVFFNHDRLIGMVGQHDTDDKGFLNTAELEEFITFFIDNCTDEDTKPVAAAISAAAGGKVDADNMVPIIKALQAGAKESGAAAAAPPSAAPSPPPAFSKQESMNRLAALAVSTRTSGSGLAPTPEAAEPKASAAAAGPLSGSAVQLLSRVAKAMHFNQDRLIGMVGQFDAEDKGFLTAAELEEFITFFIENCADEDAKLVAAAVSAAAGGKVDADNLVPTLKALQAGAKESGAAAAAEAAAAAAPPPPATPTSQEPMNPLAALAMSRATTPATAPPPPPAEQDAPSPAPAQEGDMTPSCKQVLRKLYKAVYFNQDRLIGMVGHFDTEDKGFLTAADLEEFILFYVENSVPEDASFLAASICSAAGAQVDVDSLVPALKTMHEALGGRKGVPPSPLPEAVAPEPAAIAAAMEAVAMSQVAEEAGEEAEAAGAPAGGEEVAGAAQEGEEAESREALPEVEDQAAASEAAVVTAAAEEEEAAAPSEEGPAAEDAEAAGDAEPAGEEQAQAEEAAAASEEAPAAEDEPAAAAAREEVAVAGDDAPEEAAAAREEVEEAPAAEGAALAGSEESEEAAPAAAEEAEEATPAATEEAEEAPAAEGAADPASEAVPEAEEE